MPPKPKNSSVTLAIVATVIIVVALMVIALLAFIKSR